MNSWILDKVIYVLLTLDTPVRQSPLNFLIQYFWILYTILLILNMDILILLLLIHVCGAKYHMEWSTHHVMWWALPLGSVGVPLGFTRSGEWSNVSHRVKYTPRDVLGVTSQVREGTSWVHKMYTTWYANGLWSKVSHGASTHYVMWWALPLGSVGVPLGSITSRPWFSCSCSHIHMFSCSDTSIELNPAYNINYYNNNNVRSICYSVTPLFEWR